jgi:hypothetical protein
MPAQRWRESLAGRVIVVTGAGKGLGRCTSKCPKCGTPLFVRTWRGPGEGLRPPPQLPRGELRQPPSAGRLLSELLDLAEVEAHSVHSLKMGLQGG